MNAPTARTDAIRHIVTTCATRVSEAPARFARRARVEWNELARLERVPVPVLHRVWSLAARQASAWPVAVAEALALESLGPYGFAVLTAPTGAHSLASAIRAYPIINEAARWSLAHEQEHAIVRYSGPDASTFGECASIEAMLAHVCVGLRRVVGVGPTRVRFAHARPRYANDLAARLDCALEWDARRTELVLDRDGLAARPPLENAAMTRLLAAHLDAELATLGAVRSFAQRVREVIGSSLDQRWSTNEVASKLQMSERTLRRRLEAERTSLRALRDELRAERASELLGDRARSVGEVARSVGFTDSSAFARAFRRRTGAAPRRA